MMKAYRRLIIIFFVVSCVLISMIIIKKDHPRYLMVIGDNVSYGSKYDNKIISYGDLLYREVYKNNKIIGFNDSFAIPHVTSNSLLEMINSDVRDSKQKYKLSTYVKKSKYVFISIGINDILSKLIYNSSTGLIEYDNDSLVSQIYITGQNINQIIEDLRKYNSDVTIFMLGYSTHIKEATFTKMVEKINVIIKQVCLDNQVEFIHYNLDNENYYENDSIFYPNIAGHQFISSILAQKLHLF